MGFLGAGGEKAKKENSAQSPLREAANVDEGNIHIERSTSRSICQSNPLRLPCACEEAVGDCNPVGYS